MKTITKKTFIRAPTFVWALMLMLLVSSLIATTVWAKQGNRGKPSDPEPVIANYDILIGDVGQDIILNSPDNLTVENVVGGDWLPPPTKGKVKGMELIIQVPQGDDCGTYTFADDVYGVPPNETVSLSAGLDKHEIYDNTPAIFFRIEHMCRRSSLGGVEDYWIIWIGWEDPAPHFHGIVGRTNIDSEQEGEYLQPDEFHDGTWIVTFDDAEFGLIQPYYDGSGNMRLLWAGKLSFTVEITRTLV